MTDLGTRLLEDPDLLNRILRQALQVAGDKMLDSIGSQSRVPFDTGSLFAGAGAGGTGNVNSGEGIIEADVTDEDVYTIESTTIRQGVSGPDFDYPAHINDTIHSGWWEAVTTDRVEDWERFVEEALAEVGLL